MITGNPDYSICIFENCDQDAHPGSPYCFPHLEQEIAEMEIQKKIAAGGYFEGKKLVHGLVKVEEREMPILSPLIPKEKWVFGVATPESDSLFGGFYYGPAYVPPTPPTPKVSNQEKIAADFPKGGYFVVKNGMAEPLPEYDENRASAGDGDLY